MTKPCLYCLSEVEETALKCRYCGEWLHPNRDDGGKFLRDFSVTSPVIKRAERSAENIRFVWKAVLVMCVAGFAPLISMAASGHESAQIVTIALGGAVALIGILGIAVLSSVSHMVELLAAILRNQVEMRNHANVKPHAVEEMVHE